MDREQLFLHIQQLERNLHVMNEEMQTLKELTVKLVEENVSLEIEKENYEQLLNEKEEKDVPFKENSLKSLYDEGFHVCSIHFGTHRHGDDCLFCQSFFNERQG
ncbi:initiation control protein YabA [Jeotgalicoccus huakuii]|uniref:initiation-control protein YabA n=1 Tax=Jeotgalicoccus TaxID=227979 RepID=UPI00040A224C|nr:MULTISPECIES: initiation control protein YabA [Jeotgalicoccus]MCK1976672.1 initiation control protein YabA [Jeotgalicoccus huakuii]QQD84643.1 DUF972 family protein [Jeotgalicoccus sp. ATCC 8456]